MKKIVVTIGRYNPPTVGHAELIIYTVKLAQKTGAEHRIYTSHSHDPSKNPLSARQKMAFLRRIFPTRGYTFRQILNLVCCELQRSCLANRMSVPPTSDTPGLDIGHDIDLDRCGNSHPTSPVYPTTLRKCGLPASSPSDTCCMFQ